MGCMHSLPTLHGPMSTLTPKALPLTESRIHLPGQPGQLEREAYQILVALAWFYRPPSYAIVPGGPLYSQTGV